MRARVEFHPRFADQYEALAELAQTSDAQWELFAEVAALVNALEENGHSVEEDHHHPDAVSHPIVTSRFRTFALRRAPPTRSRRTRMGHRCCGSPTSGSPTPTLAAMWRW